MEPEGRPLTPGTSYVPPPLNSAQNPATTTFLNSTLQSSCSSNVSDILTPAKGSPGHDGDQDPKQTEGSQHGAEPEGSAQRRLRSSAFPSSLSWDSDSEKETQDEEELQHFSNPHGLAAHSPGSPSSGPRAGSEDDKEAGKQLEQKTDPSAPEEVCNENKESTKKEEPNASQLGPTDLGGSHDWNISEGAELFLCKAKPKDTCQREEDADIRELEKSPEGNDINEREKDVYTFTGDSDPESSPPAPWPHCTLIQRSRKKKLLLRPFTSLETLTHTLTETGKQASGSPHGSPPSQGAGVFGEGLAEDPIVIGDGDCNLEHDIFTCVECSIYFKKQVHLKEHMIEHSQTGEEGGFLCSECGWDLPTCVSLDDHQKRHQESRVKIMLEIQKLNEDDKTKERQDTKVVKHEHFSPVATPDKVSSTFPPLYQPPSDGDQAALESNAPQSPPGSFGATFQPQAVLYRRRFVCTQCNFSTRTSQALANHTKTHTKKKPTIKSSSPDSLSCVASSSPGLSQVVVRAQGKRLHSEKNSIMRTQVDAESSRSSYDVLNSVLDSNRASDSASQSNASQAKAHHGSEDGETNVLRCNRNRRFSRRARLNEEDLPGSEAEQESHAELDSERVGGKRHTTAGSDTERPSATLSPHTRKCLKENDKQEESNLKVLRRSNRITAALAEIDSDGGDEDEDDVDDERVQRFLSAGDILGDFEDEVSEGLKSVERKCPYCPDRFHNGIGLANHVRGHLNRVGVSYNVRHFISPEEVNAIEKRFSYQKKKKKVANFDPATYSVMHCEFCSAGFDTRAGLSSHARAHLRDFGITNWDVTISPIHILRKLFSSRPDLVIPTAPPRSPISGQEEEDEEEEEENGIIEVKLEGEMSERRINAASPGALASPEPLNEEDGVKEAEEEDERQHLAKDGLSSSPKKTRLHSIDEDSRSPEEDADTKVHDLKCELCGAQFETRRAMSSHARSHLLQREFSVLESGGAPVDPPCQTAKECNVHKQISSPHREPQSPRSSALFDSQKREDLEGDSDVKSISLSILTKAVKAVPASCSSSPSPCASPTQAHSSSPLSLVRKAPISSLLPVSSPLRSTEHKATGIKSSVSNLSTTIPQSKPIWAPQENDAPLNLTLEVDANKDIVCQLCGAWFETRKGLSSHARAHLRHFGVEYSESKGSPIALLNQLMDTDEFKHKASEFNLNTETRGSTNTLSSPKKPPLSLTSTSPAALYKTTTAGGGSTSKATSSSSFGPPAKRLKSSSMQVFRLSSGEIMALPQREPSKEIGCEFCGEYFENRKGLSSHARSHLRQMGITEWSVNGSPIDTLRELITRRGLPCALPLKPLKTPPPSSPGPPHSPLSTSSSPSALLSRLPFSCSSSPSQSAVSKSGSTPPTSSSGLILKLKPEPVQLEVTAPEALASSRRSFPTDRLSPGWSSSDSGFPLNLAMSREVEPTRDIRCEFCGEYFENRKGLSSHARSHLRQMGITEWTVNGSPIDTLREVIHKRGLSVSSPSDKGVKKECAKSPSWGNATKTSEGFCLSACQSSKFRKSPLSMLSSGSRFQKQGLGSLGPSAIPTSPKIVRISPLGKQSDEAQSVESAHTVPHQRKTFSPLPHDFSMKKKPSPDKQVRKDPSCELCGFYFENRKALASHARAHLRQFGVTEWCVNGSPIETLSAWIRSRPQKVLEMHRSYMQSNRPASKRKSSSPLPAPTDSDHRSPISPQKPSSSSSTSSSQWSSALAVNLVRPLSRELGQGSSKTTEEQAGPNLVAPHVRPASSSPNPSRLTGGLPLQAQVARSELNVRLPRGFERRPLKHPSCAEGTERDSGPPKPPRTSTVPALVPKPPTYPLVRLVGKFYTLKCRFCEVEFHGPLSVQEDWIRHLQQHIRKMNYNNPAEPKAASDESDEVHHASAPRSAPSTSAVPASTAPNSHSRAPPAELAREIVKPTPAPIPLPAQVV
ncbi:protein Wiz isoform X2 [Dunckerocampus dactyliophorus]|uniref:protein Wiz isoform X2 n=1 Tax=Dunckerocampus dactyliophorus TaxID=161453 RepID=UPI0024068660|nr:protein Wiz isoform X2 [Dunckerocampus dactyliophorus]